MRTLKLCCELIWIVSLGLISSIGAVFCYVCCWASLNHKLVYIAIDKQVGDTPIVFPQGFAYVAIGMIWIVILGAIFYCGKNIYNIFIRDFIKKK